MVIREDITNPSNFRSSDALSKWLTNKRISGICAVDTRAITRYVRINGAQNAAIYHFGKAAINIPGIIEKVKSYPTLKGMELSSTVCTANPTDSSVVFTCLP